MLKHGRRNCYGHLQCIFIRNLLIFRASRFYQSWLDMSISCGVNKLWTTRYSASARTDTSKSLQNLLVLIIISLVQSDKPDVIKSDKKYSFVCTRLFAATPPMSRFYPANLMGVVCLYSESKIEQKSCCTATTFCSKSVTYRPWFSRFQSKVKNCPIRRQIRANFHKGKFNIWKTLRWENLCWKNQSWKIPHK